jgi:hypothetical protein
LLVVVAGLHECEAAGLRLRLGSIVIVEAIWSCAGPLNPPRLSPRRRRRLLLGVVLAYRSGGGMVVRPIPY